MSLASRSVLLHLLTAASGTQEPPQCRPARSAFRGAADVERRPRAALIRSF